MQYINTSEWLHFKYMKGMCMLNKYVLVVEDNQEIRNLLVDALTLEGYKVLKANNADQAINILSGCTPNFVISDVYTQSKYTGEDVIRYLKATNRAYIPYLLITDNHNVAPTQNTLYKPFSMDILFLKMKWCLINSVGSANNNNDETCLVA